MGRRGQEVRGLFVEVPWELRAEEEGRTPFGRGGWLGFYATVSLTVSTANFKSRLQGN